MTSPHGGAPVIRERVRLAWASLRSSGDARTLIDIARELDVSASTLANWTSGAATPPAKRIAPLAKALWTSPLYLLGADGDGAADGDGHLQAEFIRLAAAVAELQQMRELLLPFLEGEPVPVDHAAARQLGRALGRLPQADHRQAE